MLGNVLVVRLGCRYHVISHPAMKHRVGTRGGVMILVDKQFTVQPLTLTQSTTNMWTAIIVRMKGTDIIIATAYLPPDDNQTNLKTMQELAHMVGQAQCPFMIGGDYNTPPEGLEQYHWDGFIN